MSNDLKNTLMTITEILEKHDKRLEKLENILKGYQFAVNRRLEKLEDK